jgi:hypothetical protein
MDTGVAYFDTTGVLESLFVLDQAPRVPGVAPVPCELGPEWSTFESDLGNFKSEFVKARAELTRATSKLTSYQEELSVLKMVHDSVRSPGLKEKVASLIDSHESEGIEALTLQCGAALGRVEAMKKVLIDTHSERYGKFACFVCMDRLVDLFIDPCGHVICDPCWRRTTNHDQCPGCRTEIHSVKKIYTL